MPYLIFFIYPCEDFHGVACQELQCFIMKSVLFRRIDIYEPVAYGNETDLLSLNNAQDKFTNWLIVTIYKEAHLIYVAYN